MLKFLNQSDAITFDDVSLVPGHSTFTPKDADLSTKISRNISLNIPLLSAAMDTVTESNLAVALAQEGGMGIIHKNMTAEEQAWQVLKVKKFENGIITDPVTVTPATSIEDVLSLSKRHGFSGFPVVENRKLQGIVTNRDMRFVIDASQDISNVMTAKEKLVTVKEGADISRITNLLHKYRIEKVLVVDDSFELKGLITVKDIQKAQDKPFACKDTSGRLRVGAAIGVADESKHRAELLIASGVDALIVDTAHGHSQAVINQVAWLKKKYPNIDIIAGNIVTGDAASMLVDVGVDGVKVGIGPGSICTTRIVAGVGISQLTAISEVAKALQGSGVSLIADGGIRYSGDIVKALVAGANCVMVGGLFAGTDETPGELELYQGRSYKCYRGMGSVAAMQRGSKDRYFQETVAQDKLVPEGVEGRVPHKGPALGVIHQLMGGVKSGMGYTGCRTISELQKKATFVRISAASIRESHVHDVSITKSPANYTRS